MRKAMLITLTIALISACATNNKQPQDDAGDMMNAKAYNKKIVSEGLAKLCAKGECDKLPTFLNGKIPSYPTALQSSKDSGHATVIFAIDEQGSTTDYKVKSASENAVSDAVITALRTWKFVPASLQGKPVKITTQIKIAFDTSE